MRLLLVEDEPMMAQALAKGLRRESMAVDVAQDGQDALDRIAVNQYDVVVLDRDLPIVHGDEVCRVLVRDHPEVRVLLLTAANTVSARVEGLNLGADDYLTKPFAFAELVARVRALHRRANRAAPPVLEAGGISMDTTKRQVERDGQRLELTRKEFGVLQELLLAQGAVVTAEQLLEKVWDENVDPFTNVLRVTVMTLRRKLGDPPLIVTVPGLGYQL
ncbi:MAG: response regulator transcription factor [Actinomycetia bacterium]|nr:response regulator transcription factor [Actinomycetes bacterium]